MPYSGNTDTKGLYLGLYTDTVFDRDFRET
jgi:hypothetical protein